MLYSYFIIGFLPCLLYGRGFKMGWILNPLSEMAGWVADGLASTLFNLLNWLFTHIFRVTFEILQEIIPTTTLPFSASDIVSFRDSLIMAQTLFPFAELMLFSLTYLILKFVFVIIKIPVKLTPFIG